MQIHLDLNSKAQLSDAHFEIWLKYLYAVTDEMFAGPNSEKIKTRAQSIATVIKIKISTTLKS